MNKLRQIRLIGLIGAYSILSFAAPNCNEQFGAAHDTPEQIQEGQKVIEANKIETEREVEALHKRCGSDVACLEKGLVEVEKKAAKRNQKLWDSIDKKLDTLLCLKGGRGSRAHAKLGRNNYYKTAAITLAGIGIGWATGVKEEVKVKNSDGTEETHEKKPYSLVGEAIISGAIFAEAACRTTATQSVGAEEKMDPLHVRLKNYIVPVFVGSLIFTGLSAGQDYLIYDQKDAFSKEKLKDYYYLGIASVMFEGMYAVGHAVKMDEVMVKTLPKLSEFISDWVKSPAVQSRLGKILQGGKSLQELEAKIVSQISETALRVGYFSVKMNAWTNFSSSVIPKLKESPLFNFIFEDTPKVESAP